MYLRRDDDEIIAELKQTLTYSPPRSRAGLLPPSGDPSFPRRMIYRKRIVNAMKTCSFLVHTYRKASLRLDSPGLSLGDTGMGEPTNALVRDRKSVV